MNESIYQYFRCSEQPVEFALKGLVSGKNGYFRLGQNVLHGKLHGGRTSTSPTGSLRNVALECVGEAKKVYLPFDLTEVLNSLRFERYAESAIGAHPASSFTGQVYYLLRPILPIVLRKHLQKVRLNGWRHFTFPAWPVDRTVDCLMEQMLLLSIRAGRLKEVPFIWFWPDGASSCAIMTHDVETSAGRDFCTTLMGIDESFGIRASFQIVPESRYVVPEHYLQEIRTRGFEINVQDLNHDGLLFRDKKKFSARIEKINNYAREFKAEGFRSAVLYRRQDWFDALEFDYDMSVPNVAHLDPQRGGCCTVMPYFVGNLVELPVTMTQDYSLFNILGEHSIDLWKQQIDLIIAKHGLMNFIIHPDYIVGQEEMSSYTALLGYLTCLAANMKIWMPLPREVASWWKDRANMRLVRANGAWQIEGKGGERARIAYASESDGQLVYSFEPARDRSESQTLASQNI